ncbi:hypothetical protein NC652_003784 [Populus alba x Populus x berolinensis]|nr:hypothetical protein NC652_003784 [Populus alba x Populus x berolinensis]
MNRAKHPNLRGLSKLTESRILKKITQFLLSVSVFSLLLSNYSSGPSFLHSLYFYLSTVPVQLFTHTLDKNCIFLLCNGLLVFVAKYSGLGSSSSKSPTIDDHHSFKTYGDATSESRMPVLPGDGSGLVENVDGFLQENIAATKEDGFVNDNDHGRTEDREIEELIVEDQEEKDDDKGDGGIGFLIIGKEGDHGSELSLQGHEEVEPLNDEEFHATTQAEYYVDDGEENGVLSTQELNEKFEEFIRKTREEIRTEAQQQYLVLAN